MTYATIASTGQLPYALDPGATLTLENVKDILFMLEIRIDERVYSALPPRTQEVFVKTGRE